MKLYCHPASTTSRPVMLFAAEEKIDLEVRIVDLFTGEHLKDEYRALNPNHLVPMLEDGEFRLTESSAILKYLADKKQSAAYPTALQPRARVNERMDWINTQVCRDFAYGFVYPQIFPMHKRSTDAAQSATLAWGKERAKDWMEILDKHLLGSSNRYLCGNALTIADYFGAPFVALGEAVRCDYSAYPNIRRWLDDMKRLRNWGRINEVIDGYLASLKDAQVETL